MERTVGRLIAFSDAVVAIAATLLILPLAEGITDEKRDFSMLLEEDGSQLLIFVVTFVLICRFWLTHHNIFERISKFNAPLFWVNAIWLISIVLLPYSTELIGSTGISDRLSNGLYIGTMLVTTATAFLMQLIVNNSPDLHGEKDEGERAFSSFVVAIAVFVVALLLAVWVPAIGLWALALFFLSEPLERLAKHRH